VARKLHLVLSKEHMLIPISILKVEEGMDSSFWCFISPERVGWKYREKEIMLYVWSVVKSACS